VGILVEHWVGKVVVGDSRLVGLYDSVITSCDGTICRGIRAGMLLY
jgi:hypothetical protein